MKKFRSFFFCYIFGVVISCGTTKEIPAAWKADYNYSMIDMRLLKDQLIRFLGYKAYNRTVIHSSRVDSTVTWGIIMPASSYNFITSEQEMQFGNRADTCNIHYTYFLKYYSSSDRSLLIDILDKESYKKQKETSQTLEFIRIEGAIAFGTTDKKVNFTYEENLKTGKELNGVLISGSDTFIVNRTHKENYPLRAGKCIQLHKDSTVYALLLKENNVLKNSILLTNKTTSKEQLMIAAYFAVIAWYY